MRHRNTRAVMLTAAALAVALAGQSVALADTGTTDADRPTDRVTDRPVDRPSDRPVDRPADRPHPCRRDAATDRPVDCRPHDGDDRSLLEKCRRLIDTEIGEDTPEWRKLCHRLLWKHDRLWKRCRHLLGDESDVAGADDPRHWWTACRRLLWNHQHAQ